MYIPMLQRSQDYDKLYLLVSTFLIKYNRPPNMAEIRENWVGKFPKESNIHQMIGRDPRLYKAEYGYELPDTLHIICHVCNKPKKHGRSPETLENCECA